jgi:ABC-type lipoprotein export system ATPase subunit
MGNEKQGFMVECENLVKIYKTKTTEVLALQGLDFSVEHGELLAVIGNSGSGKSTLLNVLGGLDRPSAGKLVVAGKNLFKLTDNQMARYKRETVGFLWQNNSRNLIPYLTALQNVETPLILSGYRKHRARAKELLDLVGLGGKAKSRLFQLSGGEQQRTAIAVALANRPKLLLADEPTGSLDTKNAMAVLDVMKELNRTLGLTVIIVTHDPMLSARVERVVAIRDGKVGSEYIMKELYQQELNKLKDIGMEEMYAESHVELAVMDKAGRIQIPKNILRSLGFENENKLRVEAENGRIVLFPMKKTEHAENL